VTARFDGEWFSATNAGFYTGGNSVTLSTSFSWNGSTYGIDDLYRIILQSFGSFEITRREITVSTPSFTLSFEDYGTYYDGHDFGNGARLENGVLTAGVYSVDRLVSNAETVHVLTAVFSEDASLETPGNAENGLIIDTQDSRRPAIYDSAGNDVTANYSIWYEFGVLTIEEPS
jgi:hypothetical protein